MLAGVIPQGDWTMGRACQGQELVCQRLIIHFVSLKQLDLDPFHPLGVQLASPPFELTPPELKQHVNG